MCEYASVIDQFKDMFSLDYASLANNFTREALVGALDFKPALDEIKSLRKAATDCLDAKKHWAELEAYEMAKEAGEEAWEDNTDSTDEWNMFNIDLGALQAEARDCVPKIDKFTIGEIGGNMFAKFFDNALQTLI